MKEYTYYLILKQNEKTGTFKEINCGYDDFNQCYKDYLYLCKKHPTTKYQIVKATQITTFEDVI